MVCDYVPFSDQFVALSLGFFHTSEDIVEAAAEANRGPYMHSLWESDRIRIRIIAFLTVGFSVYVQRAVEWARVKSE